MTSAFSVRLSLDCRSEPSANQAGMDPVFVGTLDQMANGTMDQGNVAEAESECSVEHQDARPVDSLWPFYHWSLAPHSDLLLSPPRLPLLLRRK